MSRGGSSAAWKSALTTEWQDLHFSLRRVAGDDKARVSLLAAWPQRRAYDLPPRALRSAPGGTL